MNAAASDAAVPLAGITVLERGWLSSNGIVIHAGAGDAGAVLVDTGHVTHREQTVALVRHALAGLPLAAIVNTHLHSDHCGGNAALQRAFPGVPLRVPPGLADAVRAWDETRLGHDDFGLRERFTIAGTLAPGERLVAGGRPWQVLAAPGHDPHAIVLFDSARGVLISGDALWHSGFGVVFGELFGEGGFDEAAATLAMIESLQVRVVIPGHGAPFTDVAAAIGRARARLAACRAAPRRHARHAAKVLLKYHLMEVRREPREALLRWALGMPILRRVWMLAEQSGGFGEGFGEGFDEQPARAWVQALLDELAGSGALAVVDGEVLDRGGG